jgi:hypothetical protein
VSASSGVVVEEKCALEVLFAAVNKRDDRELQFVQKRSGRRGGGGGYI